MAKKTNLKLNRKKCKEYPYYKNYEAKRRESGKGARLKHKMVRRIVKKFVKKNPEYSYLTMYLEVALLMMQYNRSYRGMVDDLNHDKRMRKKLGFSHTPSKSCLWWNVKRLPMSLLGELLIHTAGKAAKETLLVDSSSYTYNRYVWKENNKGGRWERLTLKHHVLLALNGCVVASAVTDGDCDDSPMLMNLTKTAPCGNGYLLADRKYCCKENCKEALRIGRLPCIRPPKSHTGRGLGAWSNMIRWEKNNPGSFYKKFGMRNLVESAFSSLKDRFSSGVRAVTLRMQVRELALRSICHNFFH